MTELHVDIAGAVISLRSDHIPVIERLARDFDSFPRASGVKPCASIHAVLGTKPPEFPEAGKARFRGSRNCRMADAGSVRWNDYGDAWVQYDFRRNEARITSLNPERLHELSYLIALSRSGKALDLFGRHRLHAMAVAKGNRALVLSMPMKGGKTTSFLGLLARDPGLLILSDDSPLVESDGSVSPFPLRIGLEEKSAEAMRASFDWIDWSRTQPLERMRYGKKILVPVGAIGRTLQREKCHDIVLVVGTRDGSPDCEVRKAGFLELLPSVARGLIVGEGLPMMREYFIEPGLGDLRMIARILHGRICAAMALMRRARKYRIRLGANHEANARKLHELLDGAGD